MRLTIYWNKQKRKGIKKKMARLNINISDGLNEQMREFIKENNLTITTFLHLAISKYIETQEQTKKWQELFTKLIKKELEKRDLEK